MRHVSVSVEGGVAVVVLCRGKVNALDEATIDELKDRFRELDTDRFDIPGFPGYSRPEFSFLTPRRIPRNRASISHFSGGTPTVFPPAV